MREIKFPKRNSDQTFVIFARFSMSNNGILGLVRDYVKAWVRANATWVRIWRSNVIKEERLDFFKDFVSAPTVEDGPGQNSFSILLKGRADATRWKDWAVLLVDDISTVFPEIKFEKFDS